MDVIKRRIGDAMQHPAGGDHKFVNYSVARAFGKRFVYYQYLEVRTVRVELNGIVKL